MSDLIDRQAAIDAMNARLEDIKLTWRGKVKKAKSLCILICVGRLKHCPPHSQKSYGARIASTTKTTNALILFGVCAKETSAQKVKAEPMAEYICKEVKTDNGGYLEIKKELIRCRDCKFKYTDGENVTANYCLLNHNRAHADDWYCADAEREEE